MHATAQSLQIKQRLIDRRPRCQMTKRHLAKLFQLRQMADERFEKLPKY
jgi:hypothetical protein